MAITLGKFLQKIISLTNAKKITHTANWKTYLYPQTV